MRPRTHARTHTHDGNTCIHIPQNLLVFQLLILILSLHQTEPYVTVLFTILCHWLVHQEENENSNYSWPNRESSDKEDALLTAAL